MDGRGGAECLLITTAGLLLENGAAPVSRWKAVAASAYWSARPSIRSP